MSVFGRIKNLFFSCAAQITQAPEDRPLFRVIRERKVRRIVEVGVGTGHRAVKILEAAARNRLSEPVQYTGIDLFEARTDRSTGLSLKEAYRKLKPTKANVRLVPGDPQIALASVANSLIGTELLIISYDQQGDALARAWFYVPRLLTAESVIFEELPDPKSGELTLHPLTRLEVESRATKARPRRAA